jgi:hypothetical protein
MLCKDGYPSWLSSPFIHTKRRRTGACSSARCPRSMPDMQRWSNEGDEDHRTSRNGRCRPARKNYQMRCHGMRTYRETNARSGGAHKGTALGRLFRALPLPRLWLWLCAAGAMLRRCLSNHVNGALEALPSVGLYLNRLILLCHH